MGPDEAGTFAIATTKHDQRDAVDVGDRGRLDIRLLPEVAEVVRLFVRRDGRGHIGAVGLAIRDAGSETSQQLLLADPMLVPCTREPPCSLPKRASPSPTATWMQSWTGIRRRCSYSRSSAC
jgi:hypothetical protein